MSQWQARDHQWGTGKIHLIDPEDTAKLLCGKRIEFTPGQAAPAGASITCMMCQQVADGRKRRAADWAVWNAQATARERDRARASAEWHARFEEYLQSEAWADRRDLVLHRARWICEGCGREPATQVHHLTYDHVFDEFLWELRAVCRDCHERWHQIGRYAPEEID
jgi:hypothetical protein